MSSETPPRVALTGGDTELGLVTIRALVRLGAPVAAVSRGPRGAERIRRAGAEAVVGDPAKPGDLASAFGGADVIVHLSPQVTNTLVHDGRAWRGWAERLPREAAAVADAAQRVDARYLVVASYACLYGEALDADESTPLVPPTDRVFEAAARAERIIEASGGRHCLARLGFLYGPQSKDLARYVTSFRLWRPYYAGPSHTLGNWLHFDDAADALTRIVVRRPADPILNVVDGHPANFGAVIDHFATLNGFHRPAHLPRTIRRAIRFFIWNPQQVLLETTTTVQNKRASAILNWSPRYPSYVDGLRQTLAVWRSHPR